MARWVRRHLKVLATLALVGAVVVTLGLYWFAPWKLFTDQRVDEALPPVVTVAMSTTSAAGTSPAGTSAATTQGATTSSPAVSPAPPVPTPTPAAQLLSRGSLISHEHATKGTVSVVRQPDGSRVLAIADLDTSNGPDLRVWLSNAPVKAGEPNWYIFDDEQYQHLSLGALKGNLGNQVYTIPAAADLAELTSVTIWCDRFNVSFGAATLQAA